MDVKGTVTISLEDYTNLNEEYSKANTSRKHLLAASKEIEVFLSFLVSRESISDYVDEYNRQAQHSQIVVVNDRVKIKFNETNTNKRN